MNEERTVLIYDGLCRFCTRAVNLVRRIDAHGLIDLLDANDAEQVAARFPQVQISRLEREMCAVRDGVESWGYDAFRVALDGTDLGRIPAALMRLAPIRALGLPVYRYVAEHRRQFGCRL